MNATVTLPLSEIDTLRNDLQKAVDRVKEFESTQKKILVEIREQYTTFKIDDYRRIVVPYTDWRKHPHQYINMEDIINPIRDEETAKVQNDLYSKDKAIKDLRDQFHKLEIKSNEKIKQITEEYELEIKKLKGEQIDKSNKEKIEKFQIKNYEQDRFISTIVNSRIGKILFKKQINNLYKNLYGQKKTTI